MFREKKTKAFALVLALAINALVFVDVSSKDVGIYFGCPPANRLYYQFFHAGILHCWFNLWCFLYCVFCARVSFPMLVSSFGIAACAPAFGTIPTIGLSGECYALLGLVMSQSPNKVRYNIIIGMSWLITALLIPNAANAVHLYCYIAAVASYMVMQYKVPP